MIKLKNADMKGQRETERERAEGERETERGRRRRGDEEVRCFFSLSLSLVVGGRESLRRQRGRARRGRDIIEMVMSSRVARKSLPHPFRALGGPLVPTATAPRRHHQHYALRGRCCPLLRVVRCTRTACGVSACLREWEWVFFPDASES